MTTHFQKLLITTFALVVGSSSLYGAKPKAKTATQQTKTEAKQDPNEYEVTKSDVMPALPKPPIPPVVRDNKTQTVYDPTTKLMWQDNSETKTIRKEWQDVISYCDNLSFAGYSDWRLPTMKELLSITDMNRVNPAIKQGFQNVDASSYWSSSPSANASNRALCVSFDGGNFGPNDKNYNHFVRCVRDSK